MIWLVSLVVGAGEIAFLLLAIYHTARLKSAATTRAVCTARAPAVTILKPLCGTEPRLYECLRSFCALDYPSFQLVFGLADPDDPARGVVDRLINEFPACDIALVIGPNRGALNPKVGNLINMMRTAKHDLIAISDSDVLVAPDCLAAVVAEIATPEIGAVTCLYRAVPQAGLASLLGALYIDEWFIPSTFVDVGMNGIDFCFGPLSILRRSALDAIDGIESLQHYLADDYMMGKLIAKAGYQVRLSIQPVYTIVAETGLRSLIHREVRWGRTVRSAQPLAHFMTLVTLALPLPLLALLLRPNWTMAAMVAVILVLRLALHRLLHAKLTLRSRGAWLLPLREMLCFLVWVLSLSGRRIQWRDRKYEVANGGALAAREA